MKDWLDTKLGEVIDLKTGFPFKSDKYSDDPSDIRLLRGDNIIQGCLRWDDVQRWPKNEAHEYNEYMLQEGDVILAMDRPWIEAGLKQACIRKEDVPCLQVQRTARLRGKGKLRTDYLRYIIADNRFTRYIKLVNTGSNIPHISGGQIRDFHVFLPPLLDQEQVAKVLKTLDDKIELNRRLNEELEGLSKLLYDYWFVQFDFQISEEQATDMGDPALVGKPYRQSGGKMIYNTTLKREIPYGWRVVSLPDIATFTNGIACQKYPADGSDTLRVIKIKEMRDGFSDDSDIVTSSIPEKVKIYDGDLLFSWSASLEVMIWSGGNGALNQHIFKVTSESHPRSFCYFVLLDYLKHFQMIAELRKTTMGHITKDHLDQSRIPLPPSSITNKFEKLVNPLIERMLKSHAEIHELTSLRNWLLPMLMNGQVTVRS